MQFNMRRRTTYSVSPLYLLLVLLFYVYIFYNLRTDNAVINGIEQYADEIIALLAVPLFFGDIIQKHGKTIGKSKYNCFPYLACFVFCGLLSGVIYRYQKLSVVLGDCFLCIKFWMTMYVGYRLFGKIDWDKYANRLYFHAKLIIILYLIFAFFASSYHDIRYGIRSLRLFYGGTTTVVAHSSILFIILLVLKRRVSGCTKYMAILLVFMCMPMRSKGFGSALCFALLYYFVCMRKKRITLRTIMIMLPPVILVGFSQLYYYYYDLRSVSARFLLTAKSFQVAKDYLFGAGFGTYASYLSGVNYSPLYHMYGLDQVFGLINEDANFVSDTFWPMILGQTGYVGTAFYIVSIFMVFKTVQSIKNVDRYLYCAGLCILSYLFIESIAASSFVHPSSMHHALWLGIILAMNSHRGDRGSQLDTKACL